MSELLCRLDLGTTGARALAVTPEGAVVAEASASYPVLAPRPGWTEQRPEDWLEASRSVLSQVAREAAGEIVALGLTGQMHGSIFLDGSDGVVWPALLCALISRARR